VTFPSSSATATAATALQIDEAFGGGQSLEQMDVVSMKDSSLPSSATEVANPPLIDHSGDGSSLFAHRHFLYLAHQKTRRLSSYDVSLYISLIVSVALLCTILVVQYRLRQYETRETFFIVRNLVIALLLIQLTFLFGTTFHMDLFWIRVAQFSPSALETPIFFRVKHILCLAVPIFLHFIHLATLFWMLSHTILLYQRFWRPVVILNEESVETNIEEVIESSSKGRNHNKKAKTPQPLPNSSQLCSTSRENRRRYLKQTRSKAARGKRAADGLTQFKVVRLLALLPSVMIAPLRQLATSFKSVIRGKSSSSNCDDDKSLQCGSMQMESIQHPAEAANQQECEQQQQTVKQQIDSTQNSNNNPNNNVISSTNGKCNHLTTNNDRCEQQQSETSHKSIAISNDATASSSSESNNFVHRLLTSCCCNCVLTYCGGCTWRCQHYLGLAMGLPFFLVLLSYLLNPRGYETRR